MLLDLRTLQLTVAANHAAASARHSRHLRALGIPLRLAKAAAVRELVLEVPAPVVADALGFHHTTTTRQVRNVGGGWTRYAAARQRCYQQLQVWHAVDMMSTQRGNAS
ncbi:hypothetical protein AB0K15_12210 [Amycolatopsis sp. NPDC049253]|uniref:hypothetical protein n=1 Tax=Amycolatopsis sp. NPDC049253 TaxID=3155274 RepID=UPI00342E2759